MGNSSELSRKPNRERKMNIGTIGRSMVWLLIGVVLAAATFFALEHGRGPESITLRSYDVRPEIANEVVSALRTALAGGASTAPAGRVTLSPTGQLLVSAPP